MSVGAATMRVVLVHVATQLPRMLARHFLIPPFPNQDRGMVPVIDNHVPERCRAHRPSRPACVRFAIYARLIDDEAEPIAGSQACRTPGAVAPPHEIATHLFHEA